MKKLTDNRMILNCRKISVIALSGCESCRGRGLIGVHSDGKKELRMCVCATKKDYGFATLEEMNGAPWGEQHAASN